MAQALREWHRRSPAPGDYLLCLGWCLPITGLTGDTLTCPGEITGAAGANSSWHTINQPLLGDRACLRLCHQHGPHSCLRIPPVFLPPMENSWMPGLFQLHELLPSFLHHRGPNSAFACSNQHQIEGTVLEELFWLLQAGTTLIFQLRVCVKH